MFSDKKEENRLPDLPPLIPAPGELPPLPAKPTEEMPELPERHPLPSFPDNAAKKGFAQAAIKEAVKEEKPEENTVEMEEWQPSVPPMKKPIEPISLPAPTPTVSKEANVFVNISRFHSAKKALETTKDKLEDIDKLLKRIREIKMREEQELSSWEKELTTIRARITEVTENIFEKMDVCQRLE
jgi:hypothetical protein